MNPEEYVGSFRGDIPDTDITFYLTYDGANYEYIAPYLEDFKIPVMKNASNYWLPGGEEWKDLPDWDTELIVDCGGYSIQLKYGEYPWSIESYNSWLNSQKDKLEWAPVMDYACEERFDDKWHYHERMEKSLENTIAQFDMEQKDWRLVPVLQGRTIHDYLKFYDWLNDHGIPTDMVGLGTVCRLSNTQKIVGIEKKLRKRTDIEHIHGYGVKVEAFKHGAMFDSADSAAWVYPVSFGDYYGYDDAEGLLRKEGDVPRENRLMTMISYYAHVKELIHTQERKREAQTSAIEW